MVIQKETFGAMNKLLAFSLFTMLIAMAGCTEEKALIIAKVGNAGSVGGGYGINDLYVQTVSGNWVGFNYGAVNGYPGKSADIGGVGIPSHIKGSWRKGWDGEKKTYFYIDAPIDSKLAEQKVNTLNSYYKKDKREFGVVQIVVNEERVQVLYSKICVQLIDGCQAKQNADPSNWVTRSPSDITDVVVLFDGKGTPSSTPYDDVSISP